MEIKAAFLDPDSKEQRVVVDKALSREHTEYSTVAEDIIESLMHYLKNLDYEREEIVKQINNMDQSELYNLVESYRRS